MSTEKSGLVISFTFESVADVAESLNQHLDVTLHCALSKS